MSGPISDDEVRQYRSEFNSFDINGDGSIEAAELMMILKNLGEEADEKTVTDLIAEVDTDNSGTIDFSEFLSLIQSIRSGKKGRNSNFARVVSKQREMIQVKGHSGLHTFAQEEMTAFAEHFNFVLKGDRELDYLLPMDTSGTEMLSSVGDGVLLSKFINKCIPETIDERALNKRKNGQPLSLFKINENLNLAISSAKSIGIQTVNLGSTELGAGVLYPHLVLGLVWQLVKLHLLNSINLKNHPYLIRLLQDGEDLADLMKLPPDQILLRWINYHLANAGHPKRVNNFSGDVKDSVAYTILLNQISPLDCDKKPLNEPDMVKRAGMVINNAQKLNVHTIVKPGDIASGNARLNLVFVASIFNTCPGLDPITKEEELELAGLLEDDYGDSREERAFRMWMNSLGIDGLYVNSLYEDCKDGLILLKVLNYIEPGCVPWNKAEMNPNNKFKKISNCNLAIDVGKSLGFSLVNIGGVDINSGNRKLLLALVWQMMRYHTIKLLNKLGKGKKKIEDAEIIAWANEKVASAGRQSRMKSFKDKSLCTSHFFFDLLYAIEPRIINWDLVTDASNEEDKLSNAKYAISVARKLNCTIFLLPEDIVEVKDKMILTFVAAMMAVCFQARF